MAIANTPKPPYYAVIFTSLRTTVDDGYDNMNEVLFELAEDIEGYLGMEAVREDLGIAISYWASLEAIDEWRHHAVHNEAKRRGINEWYSAYKLRIARVETDYDYR